MKVTFPHMGHLWISLVAMLDYLGVETVVPPPSSKKTLALGTKYAPEFACLPLKLNLGNFIEAYEMGADTILMAGGCGPCRFGYYAQVEYEILKDLGYNYHLVVLEPPERHVTEFLVKLKQITGHRSWWAVVKSVRFGFLKARAVDELEISAHRLRPREVVPGSTDRALTEGIREIVAASTPEELTAAVQRAKGVLSQVRIDPGREVLRVGIVGEIFTLLEPFVNFDIERRLGSLGVEVDRSIYLSEWINDHLFMGLVRGMRSGRDARRSAPPYLNHFVGGHGQESVGNTVKYARQGYDGVIQLLPFTCMPEIVARSVLPRINGDFGIPTLTLIVDEQSGEAGIATRLEAFVDLLARRRQKEVLL